MFSSFWASSAKHCPTSITLGRHAPNFRQTRPTSANFCPTRPILVEVGPNLVSGSNLLDICFADDRCIPTACQRQVEADLSKMVEVGPNGTNFDRARTELGRSRPTLVDLAQLWSKSPELGRSRPRVGRNRPKSVEFTRNCAKPLQN